MADQPQGGAPQGERVSTAAEVVVERVPLERSAAEMKVYLKADMEGISGVVHPSQVVPGSPQYEEARRLLMSDLNAVLEGAFAGGCAEALIYDMHGGGRNIDLNALDRRASVIAGQPPPREDFFYGLDGSFSALFLVGAHARAGAADALLPRTYEEDIVRVRVNGTEVGEIGLEAALAGKFGVPLAFVSGDSGGVREARELLGDDVETVEVKRAITATSGVCLPSARTRRLLRDAAYRAARRARQVPPVVFQSPTTLEVTFDRPESAAALEQEPGIERAGTRTVRAEGASILTAYRAFMLARSRNGAPARRPPQSGSSSASASQ
ncbi:MAG: M55 family metallopeptidase [Planctomycetota bacterium]|jgi:D-amino peptidase